MALRHAVVGGEDPPEREELRGNNAEVIRAIVCGGGVVHIHWLPTQGHRVRAVVTAKVIRAIVCRGVVPMFAGL